jgi:heptosyltransferase-2
MGLSDDFKYRQNTLTHQQVLHLMAELPDEGDCYDLTVTPDAAARAREIVASFGLPAGTRLVGVNTGCGPVFETKAWTIEGFTGLCGELAGEGDIAVVLLGGAREKPLHDQILAGIAPGSRGRVLDGGTSNSLEVFFALVDQLDAVVSADTLAMHVAIALRKHVVAFFGPTCHQEIDLYGRGEKIITDYPCSPCYLKRCDVRPSCMQALAPSTVAAATRRVLAAAMAAR